MLTDFVSTNIAFFLFNLFRFAFLPQVFDNYIDLFAYLFDPKIYIEQAVVPLVCVGVYWLSGFYNLPFHKSRLQELMITFSSILVCTVLIFLALLTNDMVFLARSNYVLLAALFGILFIIVYIPRGIITNHTLRQMQLHHIQFQTVIIGASQKGKEAAQQLSSSKSMAGYRVIGYVEIPGEERAVPKDSIIPFPMLEKMCREKEVEQIIIAPYVHNDTTVLSLLNHLFPLGVSVKISPDTLSYVTSSIRLQDIYGEPLVDLTSPDITEAEKNIKRMVDVVCSAVALIIFAIPFLIISVIVKKGSPGPVFYVQERIGYRQKPFKIYKFRSMCQDSEKNGPALSTEDDPRITPFGKIMRKYRIDELPQFWNVLKGDMSLVGPRPERAFYIRQILEKAPWFVLNQQVRPGITSWGMVKFGYANNVDEMVTRGRFDLVYLANMSNLVDLKIMIYTLRTVIKGQGV